MDSFTNVRARISALVVALDIENLMYAMFDRGRALVQEVGCRSYDFSYGFRRIAIVCSELELRMFSKIEGLAVIVVESPVRGLRDVFKAVEVFRELMKVLSRYIESTHSVEVALTMDVGTIMHPLGVVVNAIKEVVDVQDLYTDTLAPIPIAIASAKKNGTDVIVVMQLKDSEVVSARLTVSRKYQSYDDVDTDSIFELIGIAKAIRDMMIASECSY